MDDEEVVFEGSAIHQHLLNVGYTDFEHSTYTSPACQGNTQEGSPSSPSSASSSKRGWLDAGSHWCSAFPLNLFGGAAEIVRLYTYTSVAREVSKSRLINEDDWLVLEHFLPDGEELRVSGNASFPWHSVLRCRDVAVIVLCLLLLWMAVEDLLLHSSLLIVAFTTLSLYGAYWLQKTSRLKQFVSSLKEMNHLALKAVRLLQEMDLIGKGFVLAQGPGAPLASLYEESPQMSCLSQVLQSTLSAAGKTLLLAHTALEQRVPHYPGIRNLFDEPPVLEDNCTFTQQLQYLKSRVTVVRLQTSAVLTELLLWMQKPEVEVSEYNHVVCFMTAFYKEDVLTEEIQSLKRQYEYNKSFWLTERPASRTSQSVEEKKKNVYLAIHSLGLHLQAALVRAQSLEAKFERESDTSKPCDSASLESFPPYEHLKTQLNALRLELDSCRGCIEEAEVRAERKYGVTDQTNALKTDPGATLEEEEEEEELNAKPLNVLLYDQQVAPAEDEVFEAYIEEQRPGKEEGVAEDDLWCVDARKERRRLRQQKEQGKRVLRELQPILTNRRKIWEEREKVALEKHTKPEQSAVQLVSKGEESQGEDSTDDTQEQNTTESVNIEELNLSALRGSAPTQPSKEEGEEEEVHEVDSDEERLRTYKKVRQEMEDEDSDQERLRSYRKVRQELDEDSDDERLRTYRKVRRELDEDEKQRTTSELRLKAAMFSLYDGSKPSQSSDERKEVTSEQSEHRDSKENAVSAFKPLLASNRLFPSLMPNACEEFTDGDDEAENTERLEDRKSRLEKEITSGEAELLDVEYFSTGCEERTTDPQTATVEETFTHNENISDDETRKIDWTTFTLPTHRGDDLDDRLHLYAGASCLGFQAEVAAKATAASRNFWATRKQPEETFGGVGEGEVFGDSDEEEEEEEGEEQEGK